MEIEEIYKQFDQQLYKYIRSKVINNTDAEDILQDVYLKIIDKIDTLGNEAKLKSWVFSITHHAIIDFYRKLKKKNEQYIDDWQQFEKGIESEPDNSKGLENCIAGFINQLPEDYREIITQTEIKGIKQKDLAEYYKMPYVTLKSKVQRGRERLKKMLLDCCVVETDCMGNILEYRKKDCAKKCKG